MMTFHIYQKTRLCAAAHCSQKHRRESRCKTVSWDCTLWEEFLSLRESIDSLFLSFVHCVHAIENLHFLLLTTADSDILNKKNLIGNIRKTNKEDEKMSTWLIYKYGPTNHGIEHASSGRSTLKFSL